MSETALEFQPQDLRPTVKDRLTASQIKADVKLIQEVMKAVMQKDVHFGTIPGTPKPTLYKPGAEKIMATFRLSAEPFVEDLSSPDEVRYRTKVKIVHQTTGIVLGWGIGECSSNETKYKWVRPVCRQEFDETPEDRRREKWQKKYGGGVEKIPQIRPNLADSSNTVLKMSKKRALIDGVLTTTAASDIFTQDIEDLPDELREAAGEDERPTIKPAEETPAPAAAAATDFPAKIAKAKERFLELYHVDAKTIDAYLTFKKLKEPAAVYAALVGVWNELTANKTTVEKTFGGFKAPPKPTPQEQDLDGIEG